MKMAMALIGSSMTTGQVLRCALEVHRALGPGLLESAYRTCLLWELRQALVPVECEVEIPAQYKGIPIDASYRADLLVNNEVLVELKAVERLLPVHEAQLLTYMRLSGKRIGLLLNFNCPLLKNGVRRFVL